MGEASLARYASKLERCGRLGSEERDALISLPATPLYFRSNDPIVLTGDAAPACFFVECGMVSCGLSVRRGRQILALALPGDAVRLQATVFDTDRADIRAHSSCCVLAVRRDDFRTVIADFPCLSQAVWSDMTIDAAVRDVWAITVGRRDAREALAHLMLEMAARFDLIGSLVDDAFDLPLAQRDLADALGLSLVHLNKSLRWLCGENLIEVRGRRVMIKRRRPLEDLAEFDSRYLSPGLGGRAMLADHPLPG